MSCYDTLKVTLPECPDEIQVNAHLTPEVQYTWTVEDRRFGTQYIGTETTDENGAITIPCGTGSAFPPGLFNRHAGVFEISVKLNPTQCGNSPMTICSQENESDIYRTVQIEFREVLGDEPAAVVGCDCGDIDPEDPEVGASLIFSFTNTDTVNITHNLGRYVQVTIYNSIGDEIEGDVSQPDMNTLIITFSEPLTGTVVID